MIVEKFKGLSSLKLFTAWGGTRTVTGNVKFQEDVRMLLETPLGSIIGNPNFGSKLFTYIYLPMNNSTGTLIQQEVRRRIEENYKEIKVESVDVTFDKRTVSLIIGMNNSNSNVIDYINLDISKEVE